MSGIKNNLQAQNKGMKQVTTEDEKAVASKKDFGGKKKGK